MPEKPVDLVRQTDQSINPIIPTKNATVVVNTVMNASNGFISSLDHLPCDIVRSLWVIQSLNLKNKRIKMELNELTRGIGNQKLDSDKFRQLSWQLRRNSRECTREAQHIRRVLEDHTRYLRNDMKVLQRCKAIRNMNKIDRKLQFLEFKRHYVLQHEQEVKRIEKLERRNTRSKIKLHLNMKRVAKQPHQEVYCFCRQPAFGKMVACDNPDCPYEWFHYGCIGLTEDPDANEKWFCSDTCRQAYARKHI